MQVTEAAAHHIKDQIATRGKGLGVRIGLKKAGCTGFEYTISYLDSVHSGDITESINGVMISIPHDKYSELGDISIDYIKDKIQSGISIENPGEKNKCGCGKSIGF